MTILRVVIVPCGGAHGRTAPRLVRAADRNGRKPDSRDNDLGFRLVLEE